MNAARRTLTSSLAIVAVTALSACGQSDSDGAAGLAAGEAEALERAAERLDSRATTPGSADSLVLENETRSRVETEVRGNSAN